MCLDRFLAAVVVYRDVRIKVLYLASQSVQPILLDGY